ncbi:hypothetical protein N7448_009598 [Penicillium atrosanguineum]|uniref:Metallo-beta-lactamase domain-containing protein n=1 Tax=Penicillium atrosanguineum TaxID=1132637 RepID=A0A9W9GKW7_9EURO|nr:uncharacterized protein N7443_006846 [Penicillium atrosanguineum]KAJ5123501.1 hypothetical protein N7448_009598 [Penicillium atrosanguineum]KAJ5142131.1 hypothetical protein N7526_003126 [Penicillium atrosanguineum]KAJ5298726.1 hypothetical protein N7443_006846 [Penicillium atrosanguineum]KAJ5321008.1 hypothetical protein N7476_004010 [Penicillium atrosanguineum]
MTSTSQHYDHEKTTENANRGLIAKLDPCIIKDRNGRVVWDNDAYDFLSAPCPDTANPKLWRQAQLVALQGLFKVTDGIYQIRGLDLSNMTIIEGDRGIVVVDPLTSAECAEAALNLYYEHFGKKPVSGMIYTHSHADHFGGAKGIFAENEASSVPILAPYGFLEHAVAENIYAGNAMARRAAFMYGDQLQKGPSGQISCGLGATVSAGTVTLIAPTVDITHTGQVEVIDGIAFVFQVTPGTEAPAEMNFFLPQYRTLCVAENATQCLHNIATLRGAAVRDALAWSSYLDETIVLYGEKSDIVFASHHWPTWGQDAIIEYLTLQRDLYAFLHDQTLRRMNDGLTGIEIAEEMQLPVRLQNAWHAQGFYGSVSHNVKAIYQRYMTWFDGNPAHLWEHPPVESAKRYVDCMGGVDEVIEKANTFSEKGDLRFAATLLNHAVFADPGNKKAKELLASTYEKLGHGCENGPWRNFYISGATELRGYVPEGNVLSGQTGMAETLSLQQLFASVAVRLDGSRAQEGNFIIDLYVSDRDEHCRLIISNGALIHRTRQRVREVSSSETVDFSCSLTYLQLMQSLAAGKAEAFSNEQGERSYLDRLLSLLVTPNPSFKIVTP